MLDRFGLKRALAGAASVGALVFLGGLVLVSRGRREMLADTGETRAAVREAVTELLTMRPASLDDVTFRAALEQMPRHRYVATVWLLTPDGRIVYSSGSTSGCPAVGASVKDEWGTGEMQRVLAALPDDALSGAQRTMLLSAALIRAEGTHNDVYRHLLEPVRSPDGSLVGLLGMSYDVSPSLGARPSAGDVVCMLAFLAGLAVFWLSLPLWVFLDARERGERAWVWAMFTMIGNLAALFAYILARSPRTAPHAED
ncbi:MAG: hypothetical protein ACYTFZ_02870 [Planctomycetota bacterium]|jgi:hypothetical protein